MKVLLSITLTDLVKILFYLFVFLLKRQKTGIKFEADLWSGNRDGLLCSFSKDFTKFST